MSLYPRAYYHLGTFIGDIKLIDSNNVISERPIQHDTTNDAKTFLKEMSDMEIPKNLYKLKSNAESTQCDKKFCKCHSTCAIFTKKNPIQTCFMRTC